MKAILTFFKKVFSASSTKNEELESGELEPLAESKFKVYSRSEHNISRSQMSENAIKVLYRLKKSGYEAYLVGVCVRD